MFYSFGRATPLLWCLLLTDWPLQKQKLLRTSLVQPLSSTTQLATIVARQDFVNLLIQSEEAFFDLSETLNGFPDLELISATSSNPSRNPFIA